MKGYKETQAVQNKKAGSESKAAKTISLEKKAVANPLQFEEEQSMNIRMKPQPLTHSKKQV